MLVGQDYLNRLNNPTPWTARVPPTAGSVVLANAILDLSATPRDLMNVLAAAEKKRSES